MTNLITIVAIVTIVTVVTVVTSILLSDKRVAALVGSVFEEWLEAAPRKAVLLAYPELGVKVTKALLALGKVSQNSFTTPRVDRVIPHSNVMILQVEAKLRGRARFGKVNYVANELSLIPSPSFAVYTLYRNHKVSF